MDTVPGPDDLSLCNRLGPGWVANSQALIQIGPPSIVTVFLVILSYKLHGNKILGSLQLLIDTGWERHNLIKYSDPT